MEQTTTIINEIKEILKSYTIKKVLMSVSIPVAIYISIF